MKKSLDNLYSKYIGSWVSVSKDYSRVYAHSKDLDNLIDKVKTKKIKKGMIMKVPNQRFSAYVG